MSELIVLNDNKRDQLKYLYRNENNSKVQKHN